MAQSVDGSGGVLRLVLSKDDQGSCTQALRDESQVLTSPLVELVIDFADCDHLEAEAVDALGVVMDRAVDDGANISLKGVSPNVRVILGIAGLLQYADARNGD